MYGVITFVVKSATMSVSKLESASVAAIAMLNNAPADRNRSASDVTRITRGFRRRGYVLEIGYFPPLLWAVRVITVVNIFYIGVKYSGGLWFYSLSYGRYDHRLK